MLDEQVDKGVLQKRIAVQTAAADFDRFLQELLRSWGFELCAAATPDVLLLAEEGVVQPHAGQTVVWLTRSHYHGRDRLSLPLQFEALWQTLEHHFHRPPRMHIRMALDLPALVTVRGRVCTTTLSSLSDMGGRFFWPQEMARDEQVQVQMEVFGVRQRYDGCVIFAAPSRDAGNDGFRIGVVFHGLKRELRDGLRTFLILRYLEAIRGQMPEAVFLSGLSGLDLPPEVRQALGA